MSDTLSAFIISAIEFIIGGLMLLLSAVYLFSALSWNNQAVYDNLSHATQISAFGVVVILLATYPLGILSESLSRALMEHDLVAVTTGEAAFWPYDDAGAGKSLNSLPMPTMLGSVAKKWDDWRGRKRNEKWQKLLNPDKARKNDSSRTRVQIEHDYVHERERQRTRVMLHAELYADVELQLKRLRLERMTLLSTLLAVLGVFVRLWKAVADGTSMSADLLLVGEFCGGLLLSAILALLVHSRFRRYCSSIAKTFAAIPPNAASGNVPNAASGNV